jgi:lactate permease
MHVFIPGVVLWPMTDIGGGLFSLVVTAIFLRVWQPRTPFRFQQQTPAATEQKALAADDPHAAEARALVDQQGMIERHTPLTALNVARAWAPYVLMSIALMLTGLVRQKEEDTKKYGPKKPGPGFIEIAGGVTTNYQIAIPTLHRTVTRDPKLREIDRELLIDITTTVGLWASPVDQSRLIATPSLIEGKFGPRKPETESALFNFAWLTAPGTAVFIAAILSMILLRTNGADIAWIMRRTLYQMKVPIPTISFMLGLSYVTRYAGMDATLGVAFAATGAVYPFFAAILGWLGVFLTGTDAGSNALFGSLQKITATQLSNVDTFSHLSLEQSQVLICTANSTGGVMGKMIDAQSIVVATAATNQVGREADIFKAVLWHSIFLASLVGLLVLLQAYVPPFTLLVPRP